MVCSFALLNAGAVGAVLNQLVVDRDTYSPGFRSFFRCKSYFALLVLAQLSIHLIAVLFGFWFFHLFCRHLLELCTVGDLCCARNCSGMAGSRFASIITR